MALRRLALRDVAIVHELELEFGGGFTVLTGETGAGKSILIDALQLALGARADAAIVREGAARAEVSAEFDAPGALLPWLEEAGFAVGPGEPLLLRRLVDSQGRSRAWINGSAATVAQLREAADMLVDIHGQHAWQSLARPAAVRALLDEHAGVDGAALLQAWGSWRAARNQLAAARAQRDTTASERERLAWQIGEVERLNPLAGEWERLEAEHSRLAHSQSLLEGARAALDALSEADGSAEALLSRAIGAVDSVLRFDAALGPVAEELKSALAQLSDAARTLAAYLSRAEPDPDRLAQLDSRLAAWLALARRYKAGAAELPALLGRWREQLALFDAAVDLDALERAAAAAEACWREAAAAASRARLAAAPRLAGAVTQAMHQLGMPGGRFEVALLAEESPQSWGFENVELRVAAHAGSTPRALARVASGGELSRLALAVAVIAARERASAVPTLIFDEVDAGIGGAVADSVGALLKQLGRSAQVFAITHLAQVAACADHHFVVSKSTRAGRATSTVVPADGAARVAEVARMLGSERSAHTSQAHARALLAEQDEGPGGPR
jgi:DNA repair protein RecN (Recombination protein N)